MCFFQKFKGINGIILQWNITYVPKLNQQVNVKEKFTSDKIFKICFSERIQCSSRMTNNHIYKLDAF